MNLEYLIVHSALIVFEMIFFACLTFFSGFIALFWVETMLGTKPENLVNIATIATIAKTITINNFLGRKSNLFFCFHANSILSNAKGSVCIRSWAVCNDSNVEDWLNALRVFGSPVIGLRNDNFFVFSILLGTFWCQTQVVFIWVGESVLEKWFCISQGFTFKERICTLFELVLETIMDHDGRVINSIDLREFLLWAEKW